MPGPVPKRDDQRRRRNVPAVPTTRAVGAAEVAVPEPDAGWHPIARDWFVSLAGSGQGRFYEPSDWQTARYVAESMSRNLSAGRFSAQHFAAVMSAMTDLLTTEGARRRARLELDRPESEGKPAAKASSRDRLRAV